MAKLPFWKKDQLTILEIPDGFINDMKEKGSKTERWVMIEVEEAYIHCSKHIPELQKRNKQVHWGTDNEKQKGGNFFKAKQSKKN